MNIEEIKDDICRAIGERKVIKFLYKKEPRVVEPYIFGVSAAGKNILLGFQTGGYSSSRKFGWKLFDLSNAGNVEITETAFNITGTERLRYSPIDKRFRKTFCAVQKG